MAQEYTADQVQQAVQSGLISAEDAQYLMSSLGESGEATGGTPWGAIAGGAAGLAAGAAGGAAGMKMANKSQRMNNMAGSAGQDAGMLNNAMNKTALQSQASMPSVGGMGLGQQGMWAGGAAGGMAGGAAGGMAGGMMDGPSEDDLIRALMDPETPPEAKQQIMQMLEGGQPQGAPMAQEGGSMPWGQIGAGLGGAALGAGLGAGGMKLAQGGLERMAMGNGKLANAAGQAISPMPRSIPGTRGQAAMGGMGALGGGVGGAMMGAPDPEQSMYASPL